MELMEIKHSEKCKVLTVTDRKEYTSTGMTTTKWNKTTQNNWKYIISPGAKYDYLFIKRRTYFFVIPFGSLLFFFLKKRLHKRYMCSFSGIITGPPRFSFRFQMRSGMFRLAHLCSVSTELLSFHWQILGSPNLCTINALKNLQIFYFSQIPHWVQFFSYFTLLVVSRKVKAGDSHKKGKLNSTYPKYNVQALMGESTFALWFLEGNPGLNSALALFPSGKLSRLTEGGSEKDPTNQQPYLWPFRRLHFGVCLKLWIKSDTAHAQQAI